MTKVFVEQPLALTGSPKKHLDSGTLAGGKKDKSMKKSPSYTKFVNYSKPCCISVDFSHQQGSTNICRTVETSVQDTAKDKED